MNKHLNAKVGEMNYDRLIADTTPPVKVASGVIASTGEAVTYPRGTALAKSERDGRLYLLGTEAEDGDTLVPDCILCDEETVAADTDAVAAVYVAGCFNLDALTFAEGYTLTPADRDKLRERGIYLGQLFE